jgi:hypothetical protein
VSEQWQGSDVSIGVGHAETRRPLTWRFALVAVVASLVAGVVVSAGVAGISLAAADQVRSQGTWAALGPTVAGAALALAASYAVAVAGVKVATRRRTGGGRFALLFALVYLSTIALGIAVQFFGVLGPVVDPTGTGSGASAFVVLPLVFTLPAALSGLIRWRWLAVVAGIGFAAAALITTVLALQMQGEEARYVAEYDGPVFAPSTSPGSPIEGYHLEWVKMPGRFDDYEGAVAIDLTYDNPEAADSYSLEFSAGQTEQLCAGEYSECPVIGTALGSPVYSISNGDYLVSTEKGVVAVRGYLQSEQVLAILNDLHEATVDELSSLTTR